MRSAFSLLLPVLFLVQLSSALYFYLEAGANKCFLEELPKDTIVVGASPSLPSHPVPAGHAREVGETGELTRGVCAWHAPFVSLCRALQGRGVARSD